MSLVDDLLTTRQLQELLQVDRITIYRMLNDGRLRGFKVGGQWRFSRREIEAWLLEQQSRLPMTESPANGGDKIAPTPQALPLSCIQTIQGVCAEALDIAAITIDPTGAPLTKISNSCAFCDLILSTEEGRRRCSAAWGRVGNGQIHVCHAGMLCVSAPIQVGGQQVAITAGCQFAAHAPNGGEPEWHTYVPGLAAELGLPEPELRARTSSVRLVPAGYLPRVSHLLRRVADTFSEIGQERLDLLSRMQYITEVRRL